MNRLTASRCAVNIYRMTKPRRRRDTRQVLLEAAAVEFAVTGLQGTRVQAIVRRARVNERMIYHHFESKSGLYRAVLEAQWGDLAAAWAPAIENAMKVEPYAGLLSAFQVLIRHFLSRPLMLPLAMHEAMTGWKMIPPASLAQVPLPLRMMFKRGQRAGIFRGDLDFQALYLAVLGAVTTLGVLAPRFSDLRERAADSADVLPRLAERILRLVLDGALAPKPSP